MSDTLAPLRVSTEPVILTLQAAASTVATCTSLLTILTIVSTLELRTKSYFLLAGLSVAELVHSVSNSYASISCLTSAYRCDLCGNSAYVYGQVFSEICAHMVVMVLAADRLVAVTSSSGHKEFTFLYAVGLLVPTFLFASFCAGSILTVVPPHLPELGCIYANILSRNDLTFLIYAFSCGISGTLGVLLYLIAVVVVRCTRTDDMPQFYQQDFCRQEHRTMFLGWIILPQFCIVTMTCIGLLCAYLMRVYLSQTLTIQLVPFLHTLRSLNSSKNIVVYAHYFRCFKSRLMVYVTLPCRWMLRDKIQVTPIATLNLPLP